MLEKVLDGGIRKLVKITDVQFGFQQETGTEDAMFVLNELQEQALELMDKIKNGCIPGFSYDRVPREVVH